MRRTIISCAVTLAALVVAPLGCKRLDAVEIDRLREACLRMNRRALEGSKGELDMTDYDYLLGAANDYSALVRAIEERHGFPLPERYQCGNLPGTEVMKRSADAQMTVSATPGTRP